MRSMTHRAPVSHGWTASVAYHSKDPINSAIPGQMNDVNPHLHDHYPSAVADSYQQGRPGTVDLETVMTRSILPETERQKREREDDTQSIDSMTIEPRPSKRARRSSSPNSIASSAWSTTAVHDWRSNEENLSSQTQRWGRKNKVKGSLKKSNLTRTKFQGPPYGNMQIAISGYYERARQKRCEREAAREAERRRSRSCGLGGGRRSAIERAEKASRSGKKRTGNMGNPYCG